jgi:hypothetical protein
MRILFFLLILANLLFFAWNAGYIGSPEGSGGEPERLAQQIAPEKIRILNPDEARKAAADAKANPQACLEWGTFPVQEVEKVTEALGTLGLGDRMSSRKVDETAGWWVYMASLGTKPNADKKVDELKRLGVTDFFIVQEEGPNKFAISLGVFRTEEAARNYLTTLSGKGVKTAKAEERETKVQKTVFRLRGLDAAALAKLEAIKKDFPGHDTKECGPEERKLEEKKGDEKKA